MSITQPKVAIITVTFNSSDFIENYLNAISTIITQNTYHLTIIDNDSQDDTCQLIKEYIEKSKLDDSIDLIPLDENVGFGRGCNAGAKHAQQYSPSHFWFLNPDTCVNEKTGESLLSYFLKNQGAHFAGSLLLNKENQIRPGAFRFPGIINTFLSETKLKIFDNLFSDYTTAIPIQKAPYTADWLTGASFMVKAESFYDLNGFDPNYFLYFEEVDLFLRAKRLGLKTWACPESQVFHISGASTGMNNHKKAVKRRPTYWFASRKRFYLKNYGALYFILVNVTCITFHLIWRLRSKLQNKPDNTPPYFIRDIIRHSIPYLPRSNN